MGGWESHDADVAALGGGRRDAVQIVPIETRDLYRVAQYLARHHRGRFTADEWYRSGIASPWNQGDEPNRGFMLVSNGDIGGVVIAMYSKRFVDGHEIRLCNISSWNVRPEYRFHSLKLLRAVMDQPDVNFTDLTPTKDVQRLNLRLGFEYLDQSTALYPHLPWSGLRSVQVVTDPDVIEARLTGRTKQIMRDHRHALPARHLLLEGDTRSCYVMFRRERRKKIPLFASLIYVSDPDTFPSMAPTFFRHLLFHHGIVATLVDSSVVELTLRPSISLPGHRPKMVHLGEIEPEKVEGLYLYSDLPALPS